MKCNIGVEFKLSLILSDFLAQSISSMSFPSENCFIASSKNMCY